MKYQVILTKWNFEETKLAKVHGDCRMVLFTNGDIGPELKAKIVSWKGGCR